MKKLNLLLPGDHKVSFDVQNLDSTEDRIKFFIKILFHLGKFCFFAFLFMLPFFFYLVDDTKIEASLFMYLLIFMIVIGALFLAIVLFKKKGIYIDPKGFLNVLLFSLLSTISILLVDQSNVKNTFGTTDLKSFAGLSVISFLAIFYFSHFFIRSKAKLELASILIMLGVFMLLVLTMGKNADDIDGFIIFDIIFLLPLFLYGLYKNKYISLLSILFIFVAIIKLSEFGISNSLLFVLSFALFLSSLILFSIKVSNQDFLKDAKMALSSLKSFEQKKVMTNLALLVHLMILMGSLIAIVYFIFFSALDISDIFKNIFEDTKNIIEHLSDSGLRAILFGKGAAFLNIDFAFFNNLLLAQGLVGLLSYIIVIGYGLKLIYQSYKHNLNDYLSFCFNLLILFILIVSLFVYPGLFAVIILWLFIALQNLNVGFIGEKQQNDIKWDEKVSNTRFSIRGLPFKFNTLTLKIILLILLTVMTVATIYGLFNIKDQIF